MDRKKINNDVIYVQMSSVDEIQVIKDKLQLLEFDALAYHYRKSGMKARITPGQYDYLLRVKKPSDQTPWGNIPPMVMPDEMPNFKIGTLSIVPILNYF